MYRSGTIFALVSREPRLYLRLPDAGRLATFLEAVGPESRNAEVARHWALVPESFHDTAEQLTVWVREAHGLVREEPKRPARRKTARPGKRSTPALPHRGMVRGPHPRPDSQEGTSSA